MSLENRGSHLGQVTVTPVTLYAALGFTYFVLLTLLLFKRLTHGLLD